MNKLISSKKCPWNVTEQYCRGTDNFQINKLRKVVEPQNKRSYLWVTINGVQDLYYLGAKGEYYNKGKALTDILKMASALGNSKVSISHTLHES